MTLSAAESARYARHLSLAEIGAAGQLKLKAAKVLAVGAGGLGCPALQYLAAAGVGTITIVDFDRVAIPNLQRQVLYRVEDCGRNKAEAAAATLRALNPEISIRDVQDRFSVENAVDLVSAHDLVVDGTDNFATRYLINDACVAARRPFVSASLSRFSGQVGIFNAAFPDGSLGPTYRCLFPEPPRPEDAPDCNAAGVLGVLPGILGSIQASEALKLLLGIGEPLVGKVLILDALSLDTRIIRVKRLASSANVAVMPQEAYEDLCGGSNSMKVDQITPKDLKARLDAGENITLIDVREPSERAVSNIGGEHIPMKTVAENLGKIPKQGAVVVYCRAGGRSQKVCEYLSQQGYSNIINLSGGMQGWAEDVDPAMEVA